MKCEEVVFIIDMTSRMKKTLTRVERTKIQKANAWWARETKELVKKGAGNEKVEKVKEGQAKKKRQQKWWEKRDEGFQGDLKVSQEHRSSHLMTPILEGDQGNHEESGGKPEIPK